MGGRHRAEVLADHDPQIAGEAEGEGDHGAEHHPTRKTMEPLRVLASLDDAVVRGGGHQEDHGERDGARRGEMHVLRRLGERFVALHQRHGELEAEQRLRTGQHHPRLGEHLDDLVLELHLASFLLGRRAVPEHQRDAVPEARRHGEGGDAERDGHGRPSRPSEVVEVEPQRHGEREQRQPHYVQGEPKQREGVLASLHQTVSRGGKQGQPHHSEKEREAGELQVLVQARQPIEGRLEERAVLESE